MRKSTLIAALAVAGLGIAGGSAFTANGLTSNAPAAVFVGGTVTQSFTGATLTSVDYTYATPANLATNGAVLTFAADADGKAVAMVFTGTTPGTFACSAVEAVGHTSTCTASVNAVGVDSVAITVS